MILVLQDVSPKISRLLSFHWNFFPILFSLPSSLIFNILCLFIAIWIIFHLIISTLVSFKWLLKSQMIVYVSFPVNESFQTSSVKTAEFCLLKRHPTRSTSDPRTFELVSLGRFWWHLLKNPSVSALILSDSKEALALRNWVKGPVTGYKLLDTSHPNYFSLQRISARRLGLVEL